jgi:hypothetical protein
MSGSPPIEPDPVVEAYKKDVDRTLIRENLRCSVEERFLRLMALQRYAEELRRAGRGLTQDLDVVYRRSAENLHRLVAALAPHAPYLRGAPPGLPFRWDSATLQRGLNFTLTTELGAIDLLGEITGGGGYEDLLADCVTLKVFGIACQCLGLERLIRVKRAAGRPKDLEAIAELEAILEERQRGAP